MCLLKDQMMRLIVKDLDRRMMMVTMRRMVMVMVTMMMMVMVMVTMMRMVMVIVTTMRRMVMMMMMAAIGVSLSALVSCFCLIFAPT